MRQAAPDRKYGYEHIVRGSRPPLMEPCLPHYPCNNSRPTGSNPGRTKDEVLK
jgi:hypothetical protein